MKSAKPKRRSWRITRTELAGLLQVTPDRITKMVAEGMPVAKTGGGRGHETVFNLAQVLPWLAGRKSGDTEKARLDRERADQVSMANAVTRGDLSATSAYAERWALMVGAARERFLALPTLALQRQLIIPAVEDDLIALVHEALTELAERRAMEATAA